AAMADVLAWILLALTVALISAHGDWVPFWRSVLGVGAMLVLCFALLRPLLRRWLARHASKGRPDGGVLAALLIGAFGCAALTEWLHLHAVFGAFLFGLCLPRDDKLLGALVKRIEPIAVLLMMPIIFGLAGQNTTSSAFAGAGVGTLAIILFVAIAGKVGGCALGARLGGHSWRDGLAVGSLMNARGLMELIAIKIGFDSGLIGPEMFTMLFIMTLVTTFMSSPMVSFFYLRRSDTHAAVQAPAR
ncbi:MAG TPA: cation:proton antiporter, partial [Rhodanobacter sp.]|nr:cation:proton antiporter [Rhodanobacter sp.]